MEINRIYNMDCVTGLQKVPDGYFDMIIFDPPYFKVVNEAWDFQWRTQMEYYAWINGILSVLSRKLRIGGTMYMYGYFRSLAPLYNFFDIFGLDFRQQIVIDKGIRSVSGRATRNYRIFPNTTECVLMLIKDNRKWFRNYVGDRRSILKSQNATSKMINEALGVKSNGGGMWSIYTGDNVCSQFPTREHYDIIKEKFLPDLPKYDKVAQTFHHQMGITDVWRDIDFYTQGRTHPTEKPIKLSERMILASTNEKDMVLDPMCGSGNSLLACKNLQRHFMGFEIDKDYYEMAMDRIR